MELTTIIGFVVGLAAVVGGQILEGGHLSQIMQFTAALIVVGGTLGATLVSFPIQDVKAAVKFLPGVFKTVNTDPRDLIDEIIKVATIARKDGVLAVEGMRGQIQDELFKNSLRHVGSNLQSLLQF
jgi:chemotaxis protein MotA